mgnify:CR=1 FL=1
MSSCAETSGSDIELLPNCLKMKEDEFEFALKAAYTHFAKSRSACRFQVFLTTKIQIVIVDKVSRETHAFAVAIILF